MLAFTSERREPQTPRWSAPEPLQLWALEGCSSRCPLSPLPWHLRHELRHSHNLHRRAMPCQLRLPLLRSLPAYAVRAQSWWHEHEQHPRKAQRSYGCFGLSVRLQCHAIFAFSFLILVVFPLLLYAHEERPSCSESCLVEVQDGLSTKEGCILKGEVAEHGRRAGVHPWLGDIEHSSCCRGV